MSRGLTAASVTAYERRHVRPVIFGELQFDEGTERLHNGLGTYTWGGNTWTGAGGLVEIGMIEEGDELSAYSVSLQLNAFDADLSSRALAADVFERRVVLYAGNIDDNGNLTADPDEFWSGWMHSIETHLGASNSLLLTAESEHAFLHSANGARFTDEDQQDRYSGDVIFEWLAQIIDAKIHWGPNGAQVWFNPDNEPSYPPWVPPGTRR